MPTLLFLDISFGEIFIIIAVIFVVFGPQKIPEFARKAGKGIRDIKKASADIRKEINQEVNNYKSEVDLERIVKESETEGKPEPKTEKKAIKKENDSSTE
jgi:sec-independent protein translocase protein TatA